MINGYFGPRLLNRHGFTEHKVDQAWIIDRGRRIDEKRIDDALALREGQGASPSTAAASAGADDFDERATREQLRDYLVVLDLVRRVQGRLPRLAVPARAHPAARPVRLRRGPLQLDAAAPSRTATRSPAPPRPTRGTSSRWS